MNQIILITGANRGIGLALTHIFLNQKDLVIATCRHPESASALCDLQSTYPSKLKLFAMDVTDDKSISQVSQKISTDISHIDVLINNAGISPAPFDASLETLRFQSVRDTFETNVIGPMCVTRTLLSLLKKSSSPKVINITSGLASLANKSNGLFYAYGISKTALNMATRTMAIEFSKNKIIIVAIDPGWVQTDMGGPNAPLSSHESAEKIFNTIQSLSSDSTGHFLYNDGTNLPW